jgi:hypothetical protein
VACLCGGLALLYHGLFRRPPDFVMRHSSDSVGRPAVEGRMISERRTLRGGRRPGVADDVAAQAAGVKGIYPPPEQRRVLLRRCEDGEEVLKVVPASSA